jgi:ABC-type phosphate transport system substrate-binding protein
MKLKAFAAACALAFTGHAFALTPAASSTAQVQFFVSGSSALQLTLGQIAVGLFQPGTIDAFFDGTGTTASGKDYRAYSGTFSSAAGSLSGKSGVIYETAKGGSIYGIVPVGLSQNVGRIDLTGSSCQSTGTNEHNTGAPLWACASSVNVVPDGGTGDVEPNMFVGINVPAGLPAVTPAVTANLVTTSSIGQPMGIILTDNIPTSTISGLSKAKVASLMGGIDTDWSQVDSSLSGPVTVCRRTPGSGTQATINEKFFGYPCSSTSLTPADHNSGDGVNYNVIENTGSGQVATCMGYVQNGTPAGQTIDITTGNLSNHAADATHYVLPAGGMAIGLMGLDRPSQNATTEPYHFTAINGVAATLDNASKGDYDVMVENSWNRRKTGLSADQLTLFNLLVSHSGDPAILGSTTIPVPGVAGLSELGYVFNNGAGGNTLDPTYPVMRVGDFSNTCQPLQQLQ